MISSSSLRLRRYQKLHRLLSGKPKRTSTLDNIRHTTYNVYMIRTQVYIPDDLYRDLKLLSATSGKGFSELIREGVKNVVQKKTKKKRKFDAWKDFIGKGLKGGGKALSSKIDYYLYEEPYKTKPKDNK